MTPFHKARARMLTRHPFFASIMMSTPTHEKPAEWFLLHGTCATAATDMKSIWWCTEFFATLKDDQPMFVLAHEVMHIVLMHGLRKQGREHKLWNIACDYVINFWLKKLGFDLPPGCLFYHRFEGFSAERVYDFLHKSREEARKNGDGTPEPGDPSWEHADGLGNDLIEPPEAMNQADREDLEQAIKAKLATAANVAKLCGKMPGDLDLLVKELISSKVHWTQVLRNCLVAVKHEDENWSRRNRRINTAYIPSKRNEAAGEIIIIPDTSDSMGEKEHAQAGGVIDDVRQQVRPERVRVVWADDCDCAREEVFEPNEPLELHPKGGGGTDMRKPLEYVKQYDPIVVIMITDCLTPWPDEPTPFPLIICSTLEKAFAPDWAECIEIKE